MRDIILVGIGGMLGAIARFVTGRWVTTILPLPSHIATLIINATGSLLLGFIIARAKSSSNLASWQIFLTAGFCGAFTTFSSWIGDISSLTKQVSIWSAAAHMIVSLVLGIASFSFGAFIGQRWSLSLHITNIAQKLK